MKKILFVIPFVATLTACSSMNPFDSRDEFQKRADREVERTEKGMNKVLDSTPDFCKQGKPKISESAVYACGESTGYNKANAERNAIDEALGKLCMTIDGSVDQRNKMYSAETNSGGYQSSERATISKCNNVTSIGAETVNLKTIVANGKFYSWAEVVIPMGDANILRKAKMNEKMMLTMPERQQNLFNEMKP